MDAEITADTAMLQDAVTHTAGCGSTSTRVEPSRPGVTRSITKNATAIITYPSTPNTAVETRPLPKSS